jgi:hypothetical protein
MYGIVGRAQRQQPAHTAFGVKPAHTVHVVNNFNFNFNIPAHFTPHTCSIKLHNYFFDLNLEHGLPTPIGYLDSSAVLSFQWGHYQDLSNL